MLILLIVVTGIMAGIYFAFSTFVMKALNQLEPSPAAKAMNSINDVIVNTVFLPIFFGSTLWYAGLILWQFAEWKHETSWLFIAAALIYIVGMFVVTAFGNVPLNNKLKASSSSSESLTQYWSHYYKNWNLFNYVRTVSCVAACALLTMALI